MLKAENLISSKVRDILPYEFATAPYTKLKVGDIKTITGVVYSVYEVLEKDKGHVVYDENNIAKVKTNSKTGAPIVNTTAYILFDDGTMSSIKYRTALNQLVSLTGTYDDKTVGTYAFMDVEVCKVEIIACKDRYGANEHDTIAFNPL